MHLWLRIRRGSLRNRHGRKAGRIIPVRAPRFVIGTAADCQLRCASLIISRQHCAIDFESDRIVVRDLGSRTGTFVNGSRIDRSACLFHGDRLRVGRLEFEIVLNGSRRQTSRGGESRRGSQSGRETVHHATDTMVDLVVGAVKTAREQIQRADGPHKPDAPAKDQPTSLTRQRSPTHKPDAPAKDQPTSLTRQRSPTHKPDAPAKSNPQA
jgi:pSer/pThr/pTyr-binding forkhead associated (FHA) protein